MKKITKSLIFSTTTSASLWLSDSDVPAGILLPNDAAFNSKTLALKVSFDEVNYFDVYDKDGTQLSITSGAARFIPLPAVDYLGIKSIKFVASGSLDGKSLDVVFSSL